MYLIHISTIKNTDGIIDITVHIVKDHKSKRYDYRISSEWAAEQFHKFYRKGRKFHGKALQYLNKFKITDKELFNYEKDK
jgi:hypothetical protein